MPSSYARYIEPFAGSACLYFALEPDAAILGDVNTALIDTYEAIRRQPTVLHSMVAQMPSDRDNYMRVRGRDVCALSELERAARFLYLNRHSFNGVYRTNRRGQFNVPPGKRVGALPSAAEFEACAALLCDARLTTDDFSLTIGKAAKGDFLYADPPYSRARRPHYGLYGYDTFRPADATRLIRAIKDAERRGADFVLSLDQNSLPVAGLPCNWTTVEVPVARKVAANVSHRRVATEVLITNLPEAPPRL